MQFLGIIDGIIVCMFYFFIKIVIKKRKKISIKNELLMLSICMIILVTAIISYKS